MKHWILLTGFALSAGCAQTAPQTPPSGSPGAQQGVNGSGTFTTSVALVPAGAQHLTDVNSVALNLSVSGAPALSASDLAVEFIAPGGLPYQRMTASMPDSTQVTQTLSLMLPVAGTFIDIHQLTGTWAAHVWVDGQERAVQPFGLMP